MNPAKGALRLYSVMMPDKQNLWCAGNVLLQKFPADEFMVTTKVDFVPNSKLKDEKAGLTIMGLDYAAIAVESSTDGNYLVYKECKDAGKGGTEDEKKIIRLSSSIIYLGVKIEASAKCHFGYSLNGIDYVWLVDEFQARVGQWIGAKVGLFCIRESKSNDPGYADFDWFRVGALTK